MPTIDVRRLVLLCITAIAWIISIPWTIDVWRSGQIPYEPIIGFLIGLASLVELFTGIVQKRLNPIDAAKENNLSNFDQSDQTVHGPQTNIAGNVQGPVLSGQFQGPVAPGGEAVDLRSSTGAMYKPTIQQAQKLPVPEQIPAPPKDFVGRSQEIDDLLARFERGATITGLQGMGGIGKTALALVLADRLKPRFPDGQLFVNLLGTSKDPLPSAAAMAHVIRSYWGLDSRLPDDQNELGGHYRTVLSGKRALILLDNAAGPEQVEPLLPPVGCAVIITSRNKFSLPGLEEKDLDVLPLRDSEKLLLEIAKRIGDRAEELARLCGCLPIALRNAAYALVERKDLGVAEYLERLKEAKNRVDLVEASFSLSYDLLSPDLQRLWPILSIFPAGFDRAGAAALWDQDLETAARAISELVKWSLVNYDPSKERYRLHDLARDFAAARLETAAKAKAQQRHAGRYRDVLWSAKQLYKQGKEGILAGLALFDLEEANIDAGQAWAAQHLSDSTSAAALCSAYPDAGAYVLDLRLHPRQKITWLEKGVEAARRLNDRSLEGVHLGSLGVAYAAMGEARTAIEYYQRALDIAREIGDKRNEGASLGNLGSAYAALGDARKAIEFYEQRLVIAREIGDRRGEGAALGNLGLAYAALGDARKAIEFYEQRLVIAREIGDRRGEGNALWNLSLSQDKLGQRKEAIANAKAALKIRDEIEDPRAEKVRRKLAEWQE